MILSSHPCRDNTMFHVHVHEAVEGGTKGPSGGQEKKKEEEGETPTPAASSASSLDLESTLPDSVRFSVGALNVEVLHGTLQLFREQGIPIGEAQGKSRTLCVVAVPPHLSVSDFVLFVGPYADKIEHLRVLRDTRKSALASGRYMCLLRFHTQKAADAFYRGYQGKPFSSFDTEVCHTFYVAQIKIFKLERRLHAATAAASLEDGKAAASPSPSLINHTSSAADQLEKLRSSLPPSDPLATAVIVDTCAPTPATVLGKDSKEEGEGGDAAEDRQASGGTETTDEEASKGALLELPTCPVCLERLDSATSGIVTTLCGHNFDSACLSRWTSDQCPVCRYTLVDEDALMVGDEGDSEEAGEAAGGSSAAEGGGAAVSASASSTAGRHRGAAACESCAAAGHSTARENVWMCLICGHLGCGRLTRGHALAHFRRTRHAYAIDLSSQRVWDYVGDGFVHRILQNRFDGKLVEVPEPGGAGGGAESSLSSSASSSSFLSSAEALARSRIPPAMASSSGLSPFCDDPLSMGLGRSAKWKKLDDDDDDDTGSADGSGSGSVALSSSFLLGPQHAAMAKKDQAVAFEYALLLTGQLEAQRQYFESIIARILSVIPEQQAQPKQTSTGGAGGAGGASGAAVEQRDAEGGVLSSVRKAVEAIVAGDEEALVEAVMAQSLHSAPGSGSVSSISDEGLASTAPMPAEGAATAAVVGASSATGNEQLRRAVISEERRLREVASASASASTAKGGKKKGGGGAGGRASTSAAGVAARSEPGLLPGGPVSLRAAAASEGGEGEQTPSDQAAAAEEAGEEEELASESVSADLSWKALERRISKGLTASSAVDMIRCLRRRCDDLEEAVKDHDRRLTNEAKLRRQFQKQYEELAPKAKKHEEEVKFLREMNETLEANQKNWENRFALTEKQYKTRLEQAAAKEKDLEEQVRDLMLNFEALRKIEEACASSNGLVSKEELKEGTLVMAGGRDPAGAAGGSGATADFEISRGSTGGGGASSTAARLKQKLALSRSSSNNASNGVPSLITTGPVIANDATTFGGNASASASPRSLRREGAATRDSALSASSSASTAEAGDEDDNNWASSVVAASASGGGHAGGKKKGSGGSKR